MENKKSKEACIGIAKNPIILGILAGLIVGLLGIEFPTIINKTVNSVAQMATPLALITIGAGFEGRKALAKIKPTIAASLIKLDDPAAHFSFRSQSGWDLVGRK